MTGTEFEAAIAAVYDEMVDTRRALHRRPELAFHEYATTALIRDRMAELDIGELRRVTETGGIFAFDGGQPGRSVVLRADIDGLPVQEDTRIPFNSDVDGTMHACGHDVHAASLLGVARALSARRAELPGRYIFLFQPAEEALCGAKRMLEGGALDVIGDARLVGFHVTSQIPTGVVTLREGIAMSEAHALRITLVGPGGHGAIPTANGDVIKATADLVVAPGLRRHRPDLRRGELRVQRRDAVGGHRGQRRPHDGHGLGDAADVHRRSARRGVPPVAGGVRHYR